MTTITESNWGVPPTGLGTLSGPKVGHVIDVSKTAYGEFTTREGELLKNSSKILDKVKSDLKEVSSEATKTILQTTLSMSEKSYKKELGAIRQTFEKILKESVSEASDYLDSSAPLYELTLKKVETDAKNISSSIKNARSSEKKYFESESDELKKAFKERHELPLNLLDAEKKELKKLFPDSKEIDISDRISDLKKEYISLTEPLEKNFKALLKESNQQAAKYSKGLDSSYKTATEELKSGLFNLESELKGYNASDEFVVTHDSSATVNKNPANSSGVRKQVSGSPFLPLKALQKKEEAAQLAALRKELALSEKRVESPVDTGNNSLLAELPLLPFEMGNLEGKEEFCSFFGDIFSSIINWFKDLIS